MMQKYGETFGDPDELRHLHAEKDELTQKIKDLEMTRKGRRKAVPRAIQAFVTFETERGFISAINAYNMAWWQYVFYPKEKLFKGQRIRVTPSPEPSTILHENLAYSMFDRSKRKIKTTGIAFVAVLLSIVFTFQARSVQEKALEKGGEAVCPTNWQNLNKNEKYSRVQDSGSEFLHCYCNELTFFSQFNDEACKDYILSQCYALATALGASISVVAINYFFTYAMNRAAKYEKHHSLDSMEISILTRTFILKFINSGCIVLLFNQKWLNHLLGVSLYKEGADFGTNWFETGGQSLLFVMIFSIFSPHIVPFFKMRRQAKRISSILEQDGNFLSEGRYGDPREEGNGPDPACYTQDDLNKLFLGPEFSLHSRYSQALLNFSICYAYSTPIPLMLWLGFFSFFVNYWVDKYLFCNFYRIPPAYSEKIGRQSTKLVGYSILIHLIISIYSLGNKAIFETEMKTIPLSAFQDVNPLKLHDNLQQRHIIPLAALLISIVVLSFVNSRTKQFTSLTKTFINVVTCGAGSETDALLSVMNTVQTSFSRAKQRGLIKGLNSYNILRNPKYASAFGINAAFANKHNHVTSLRKLNVSNRTTSEENAAFEVLAAK